MPRYDFHCDGCGKSEERFCVVAARHEQVCECGHKMTKLVTLAAAVHDDSIIGGFVQEHFGNTPETFYSKKDMARRAKELGLVERVRHVDGDRHVARWV
jgi:putative FmdB family regulatory protein